MNWYKKQLIAESHSYATVMLEINGDLRDRIFKHIESLDEENIAEEGKEDNPHVTVLYGLHTNDAEEVKDFLKDSKPFEITLGKISKFRKSDEFDVLKVDIESEEIRDLNRKLKELPHTSTHPRFNPHLTLAYVKKGRCDDMVGEEMFKGEKFKVNELVFSSKNEEKTIISLKG